MKKFLPILVLVLLAVAAWYFSSQRNTGSGSTASTSQEAASSTENQQAAGAGTSAPMGANAGAAAPASADGSALDDTEGAVDVEILPASRAFKSAEEAMESVKQGAADYSDAVLEQFTLPGEDCAWCPEFYKGLRDLLASKTVPTEQLSYYAEILSISGRIENIQALVDGIKNPASEEQAQAFSEALELTIGNDQIVNLLAENIAAGTNDQLRESSVAAITNQGSRLAAEVLYKNTVERGDPDGYYSRGTGLGELIPSDEAMPYLQEIMNKRDQYSHLAAKALANAGLPGLKMVFDSLSTSKDIEGDRKILKDMINHLNYDEDVENYLKEQAARTTQPALKEFAERSLEAMQAASVDETTEEPETEAEQYQTQIN